MRLILVSAHCRQALKTPLQTADGLQPEDFHATRQTHHKVPGSPDRGPSLAVTRDNPYIEPAHILLAMLQQDDGPKACWSALASSGRPATGLTKQIDKLPQVQGAEQVQAGRDTIALLQGAEKEAHKQGDPYIASEMFLLALADTKARPVSWRETLA
jgi:ATP-dependent Clp protease ATP-binding subunit ClpA